MKIFIGLKEIAGYYSNLKKGFQELGIEATFIDLYDHPYHFSGGKEGYLFERLYRHAIKLDQIQQSKKNNFLLKILASYFLRLSKHLFFIWALMKYDVFIMSFNSTFNSFQELPILKRFKKKIIYVFHGSDSRPPYINGKYEKLPAHVVIKRTQQKKNVVRNIDKYADVIINTPAAAQFHERPFVILHEIGLPFFIKTENDEPFQKRDPSNHQTHIVHSPSDPATKGTAIIREAIQKLRQRGHAIQYTELIDRKHSDVLKAIQECDFVVDELFSDIVMAGFATEAAFFGKPAIVGGYGYAFIKQYSKSEFPPTHHCDYQNVEAAIEKLIVDKDYRLALGREAQRYVYTQYAPKAVAARFLRLIQGNIPSEWFFDPKEIYYLHGYGLTEEKLRQFVKRVVDAGGKEALQLRDKPEIENLFLELIGQK